MNDKNDLVSIVVPVYNVEQYLEKCIESIKGQTYRELEIILVDDGSTDSSGELCDRLALNDNRIRVIHQKNGGLSVARNSGIDVASGRYIGFIDSDDYIDSDMVQKMYERLINDKSDMVICDCVCEDLAGQITEYGDITDEILSRDQAMKHLDGYTYVYWKYVTAWNKLYKRELFETLRYPAGKIHEDEYVIHRLYEKCEKVSVMSNKFYHYLQRPNSITTANRVVKLAAAFDAFLDRISLFDKMHDRYMKKVTLRMMYLQYREIDGKTLRDKLKNESLWLIKNLIINFDARGIKLLINYLF